MKAREMRKKTKEELEKMEREERQKLQQLRFDLPGGKLKNVREIRQARRNIARIATLAGQKHL